jgi:hypothetical protein
MADGRHGSPEQGRVFDPDSRVIAGRAPPRATGDSEMAAAKGRAETRPLPAAEADDTRLSEKPAESMEEGSGDPGLSWSGGGHA